jgi:hypothetical protein
MAWGGWNLKSGGAAYQRAQQEWNEALCENWSQATWKNFYGLLPGGTHYDDPTEYSGPIDYIKHTSVWEFLAHAGYL